ncbi:tetratricopeptide repeat-containing sensor histidine kinase [Yeosuana sp. MJ-SS3]|uniref:histidine kinase n=1 Tax=Gilvirhabdus luticola TaxID=3079858 RepID=A0ABU3U6K3_9FLAO|nr:tetratricopeptide repeat-containing sensor histidine kinase [Yeosuana sp. MJ-SS3]MDU8885944.1 tetratricopeptide repeat-containing sensor histidine kinase [Yeosuana sp. MJ-SS3]
MRKIITIISFLSVFISLSQTKEVDSLTIQLAFQNADTSKVKTSVELIKALYKLEDYSKALKFISETEKLSNSLNYKQGNAEVLYFKALIYTTNNDYINAIDNYSKSKALFAELNDTLGIAKVNNQIGLIEIQRGNYNKGLQYSLAAINELEKRGLRDELVSAYSNLASAYRNINLYNKAIEFNLKALNLQQRLNDTDGIIRSSINLGELYSREKENRKAIEYFENVLSIIDQDNDSLKGIILPKLGGEYLQFKDYDKSALYLIQGLQLNRKTNNENGLLISLNNLGKLNFERGFYNTAEAQLLEAKNIAKSRNNDTELLANYKFLKSLDSTRRNFARAYVWQREYYELQNSINKQRNITTDNIHSIEPFEEDLISDDSIVVNPVMAKAETLAFQQRIKTQTYFIYALIGAFIIALILLIVNYLKKSENIKHLRELEEENQKSKLQNEAVTEQVKHLEDINRVKDKLFSIVSHDLKDSLTSIKGFIDLLSDGDISEEEFDKLIPELSDNANNATMLLFNLLNWSKSQMQSLEANPSLFDVQEIFQDKINLIEQRLDNKGIKLIDRSLKDFAYADRSMIEIVIQNLLTNAVKFSQAGDIITISNHISNGSSVISVSDTGVGISEENIGKLFKSHSFTTTGTKNEKGTGLGLSICKELVELNKGKIWVESTEGVGSTFYVQLPKSKSSVVN